MSRRKLEHNLVNLKFRHFTDDIRLEIIQIVRKHRCDDVSDIVIDGLWAVFRDDLILIITDDEIGDCFPIEGTVDRISVEMKEKIRSYIDQALAYEAELGDLDNDAFEKTYHATFAAIVQEEREYRAQRAAHNDRWAFFNLPEAHADFPRWSSRLLMPAQAVALSFSKDPDHVNPVTLSNLRQVGGSPFREAFVDRMNLVQGAVEAKQLPVPMSISEFACWAEGRGFELPTALWPKKAPEIEGTVASWKLKYETDQAELNKLTSDIENMPPKSRKSLYRLVLGMAITRFEYRTDQRSSAVKLIQVELASAKIFITDETILDHLRAAANDLSFNWKTPRIWRGKKTNED